MTHRQRPLTMEEWERYDRIIAPMRALTASFQPGEISGKPFLSPQLVNASVVIVGYNPGNNGDANTWRDPHEPSQYKWFNKAIREGKNLFLKLLSKCFDPADWSELVNPDLADLVWTNLYPFHTPDTSDLDTLLAEICRRNPESHPHATCRETMARLIVEILRPKIVLCAGKKIEKELRHGFKSIGIEVPKPENTTRGVTHFEANGIHVIGFSRRSSVGFTYDSQRRHHTPQQDTLRHLTHQLLYQ